jgi:preprotein translocase subunit SecG
MFYFLLSLILLSAVLLVLVVLIQNSKGGGLASNFGPSNQILGARQTTDFLEKLTWGLAGAVIVLSISANLVISGTSKEESRDTELREKIENAPAAAQPQPAPVQGQPAQQPQSAPAK